ncbi:hypothetical protein HDU87_006128, partial [Geranomyces variabilis]
SEEDRREFNKSWEKSKGRAFEADEGNRCANCDTPLTSLDLKLKRGSDIFRDGKGCAACINHFINTGTLRETPEAVPKPPPQADSLSRVANQNNDDARDDWLSKKNITAGLSFKSRAPHKRSPSPVDVLKGQRSSSPAKKRRRKRTIVASDDDDEGGDGNPTKSVSSSDSDVPLQRALKRHRNESEPGTRAAAKSNLKKHKSLDVEKPISNQLEEEREPGKGQKSISKPQPDNTTTDRKRPHKSPPVAASSSASRTDDWNGFFSEPEPDEAPPKAKKVHRDKDAKTSETASSSLNKNEPSSKFKEGRKADRNIRRLSDRPPVSAPSGERASDDEALRKPQRKASLSRASGDVAFRKASDDEASREAKAKVSSISRANDDEAARKTKTKARASDDEVSRKATIKPVPNGTSKALSITNAKRSSVPSGQTGQEEQASAPGGNPPASPRSTPKQSATLLTENLRQSPAPQVTPQRLPVSPESQARAPPLADYVVEMDVSDSIENLCQHINSIFATKSQDEGDAASYDWNVPWLDDLTVSTENMRAVMRGKRGQRTVAVPAVPAAAASPAPPSVTGENKRNRSATPVTEGAEKGRNPSAPPVEQMAGANSRSRDATPASEQGSEKPSTPSQTRKKRRPLAGGPGVNLGGVGSTPAPDTDITQTPGPRPGSRPESVPPARPMSSSTPGGGGGEGGKLWRCKWQGCGQAFATKQLRTQHFEKYHAEDDDSD